MTKTKTLTKTTTKNLTMTRWRASTQAGPETGPALVFGNIAISKRGFQTCAQPVAPVQIGTKIMPEGFMTETGLLPSE